MPHRTGDSESQMLSPDEAFSVLGDDTRLQILQALGETDEALSFSELRSRVGIRHSGQFNYHLDKLAGHFIEKTDGRYELRQTGRRVVEAILSGAVTHDPVLDPTRIDDRCPHCDAPTMVAYQREQVEQYCTKCTGHYGPAADNDQSFISAEYGFLGAYRLPPAGLQRRNASDIQQAASTWGKLTLLAVASGICPSCSAPVTESVRVCEAHDLTDGRCAQCHNRHAVQLTIRCPNCRRKHAGAFVLGLLANTDVLAFLTAHGINPVSPATQAAIERVLMDYHEEVLSTDPFKARFTFTANGDALTLTVGEDLSVVDVKRTTTSTYN